MRNIVVFFRPDKKYGEFSNWYMCNFTIDGVVYNCIEQYMMSKKALMFSDLDAYEKIMENKHPDEIKILGRKVKNFDKKVWDDWKYDIVYTGLYSKFNQNDKLKKLLLSTGDKWIGECNKFDTIWGTGLTTYDMINYNYDLNNLPGENLLGKALMDVRDKLKRLEKNL